MRPLVLLALLSCDTDPDLGNPPKFGAGPFLEGCPVEGHSLAREIGVDLSLPGKAAVGRRGDFLLANEQAAFVISDTVEQSSYWYYGGALVDAVPMQGCEAGDDKLDDVGFVLATLDPAQVEQSTVRAFRADTVEVIADGSDGGAAIVRATGTDDIHWLVEHTLINDAADKGGRAFSQPWGTEVVVDYVLEPGSPVLRVDLSVKNTLPDDLDLFEAALVTWGETLSRYAYASQRFELGGFGFDSGIPVIIATDGQGAYAWGADDATLALLSIAGVNVITDLTQLADGLQLAPGETDGVTRWFSVGEGSGATTLGPLLERVPTPLLNNGAVAASITGTLSDSAGAPVAGRVRVEVLAPGAEWGTLDVLPTRADGSFEAVVPDFEVAWDYRVVGEGDGRDDGEAVDVVPGDTGVRLVVPPRGDLQVSITDQSDAPSPGRLVLQRDDGVVFQDWIVGSETIAVPPGTWEWTLTRGYEYAWDTGVVTIPPDGEAAIDPRVTLTLDTTGWMSIDTHVHSSDSPDSDTPQVEVLQRAAGNGLDIVLHTEHENIVDRSTIPSEAGVEDFVNNLAGEEVTHVGIEHMTMFPVEADGSPRGGYVEWYGMDIAETFDAMKYRSGGGVNLLNHPGYLDRIGWDRIAAAPTLDDPTLLGMDPDGALWDWNLDGIEVMNGHPNVWNDGRRLFDNWMSMVNAGHSLIAVGCSDDHGGGSVGFPRTYFASGTDTPADLNVGELVESFIDGRAIVSAGAFARVDVDGTGPGDLVTDTDGMVDLFVHIEALPLVDITHFTVFANCDMVESVLATDPEGVEKFDGVIPLNVVGDTQIVVAGFGSNYLAPGLPQYDATVAPRFLTNPIYVDGDGDGLFTSPGGRECSYDISVDAAM